jgi:hypothetical protein
VDATRLARAVRLTAERLDGGLWRVSGGAGIHVVDPVGGTCDCLDHLYRRAQCAHLARVRLALGDAETVAALAAVIAMPKRERNRKRGAPLSTAGARGGLTP